ncbi:efflux RND transporter periplasmic adaptor subunit [Reyranella sp.]|uniref:efflux RND transporter periplasmic adaptor subunit n=1 Tax=Reyranella sp. TaxID=1929291 RepID=UPI003C7AA4A0
MPVVTAAAAIREVPIYLKGIGEAVASRTTVVRSGIAGRLSEIAFTEGQPVQAGDLLARLDSRPFQAQLDQSIAIRDRDQALQALQASTPASKVQAHLLERSIANDEARVEQARAERNATDIRAPASGVVGRPLHRIGDIITPGDKTGLVVISRIDPISVVFTLPEMLLHTVPPQSNGHHLIRVRAYGKDRLHPLAEGRLVLGDDGNPQETRTGRLVATFPNTDRALSPGLSVDVVVRGNGSRAALTIPLAAIRQSDVGYYTYIVTESETAHVRPLILGTTSDDVVVVREGLRPGDVVVTDGQDQLSEGSHLAIVAGPSPRAALE